MNPVPKQLMKMLPGLNSSSPGHFTNDITSVLQSPIRARSSQNIRLPKRFDDYYTWFCLVKCWCLFCCTFMTQCCLVLICHESWNIYNFLVLYTPKKGGKGCTVFTLQFVLFSCCCRKILVIQMLVMFRGKHRSIDDVENPRDFSWRNHIWCKQCSSFLWSGYRWKYFGMFINWGIKHK